MVIIPNHVSMIYEFMGRTSTKPMHFISLLEIMRMKPSAAEVVDEREKIGDEVIGETAFSRKILWRIVPIYQPARRVACLSV